MCFKVIKLFSFFGVLSFLSCRSGDPRLSQLIIDKDPEHRALVERGAQVYRGTCVSCHSFDPREDGPVGPAIAGAALELLEARVLRAEYPSNYQPKRDTHKMMSMPQLKSQLPALYSYLEAYKNLSE